MSALSGFGVSPELITSYRLLSFSPSWKGASIDKLLDEFFKDCFTLLTVMSNSFAISDAEGTRWCTCSRCIDALRILFISPILFRGKRTTRDCSAMA